MRRVLSLVLTVFVTAVLAGVTAVLLPGTAAAHSSLENSSPSVGATLAEAPTSIVLVFNEGIRDFAPQIAITVGSQAPVTVTPTVDVDTVVADLTGVDIPRDPASVLWKVGYRVVSEDGHPVAGVLEFSVTDAGTPAASGSVGGAPSVTVESTTDAGDTAPADTTEAAGTTEEAAGSTEPMMSILNTPSDEPTPAATAGSSDDGHDTGSMVAWFIGGGVLIVAIVVVAVLASRRRPVTAGRSSGRAGDSDGGGDGGSSSRGDADSSGSSDSGGGSDGGGGGGGD